MIAEDPVPTCAMAPTRALKRAGGIGSSRWRVRTGADRRPRSREERRVVAAEGADGVGTRGLGDSKVAVANPSICAPLPGACALGGIGLVPPVAIRSRPTRIRGPLSPARPRPPCSATIMTVVQSTSSAARMISSSLSSACNKLVSLVMWPGAIKRFPDRRFYHGVYRIVQCGIGGGAPRS